MALSCIKKVSALLRGIVSKHCDDFCCFNWLYSSRLKSKLNSHKGACENKDFCNMIMPFKDTKIITFHQYQEFDKAPYLIYLRLEA